MSSWTHKLRYLRGPLFRTTHLPPRTWLATLLIVAGAVLLIYVASQYWSMHQNQAKLQAQWDRQQASLQANRQTTTPASVHTSPSGIDPTLTRLEIPKINLAAMVVEGDSAKQLFLGPGHITSTPLPGESGNAVITAHRDTFFRHIYELSPGDEIVVERNGQTFRYAVTGKKIVKPEDVTVLQPTGDAELTLITCYPTYYVGPAPERLVVFSKLLPAATP